MATQQATLTPNEPLVSVSRYRTVAIHGNFAAVGDPWRKTPFGEEAGAVYVFRRVNDRWVQEAELFGWDMAPHDFFGSAVAISDDMLVVGAPGWRREAVFCYPRAGDTWIEQGYLERPDVPGYGFGRVLAMDGGILLVPADVDNGPNIVYAYSRDGMNWVPDGSMTGDYDEYHHDDGYFGYAVACSADTLLAIVGAPSQGDFHYGSAYVFARFAPGTWLRKARLNGNEEGFPARPQFGHSVAISGLRAIVGSPGAEASGVAVGGAYIFEANGGGWAPAQLLRASDPAIFTDFGAFVGLTSTTALVSAPAYDRQGDAWSTYAFERVPATGNWAETAKVSIPVGDTNDVEQRLSFGGESFVTSLPSTANKAASVYRNAGGTWSEESILMPREGSRFDGFGSSVTIDGAMLAVGAKGDDPGNAENSGAVYIYEQTSGQWTQQARLTAPTPTPWEQVGFAVALSDDALVVGCPPLLNYAPPTATGHAYVFRRSGAGWTLEATLLPNGSALKLFGNAVAISGDTAVVGAPDADTAGGTRTGAAFVFVRQNGQWIQQAQLVGSEGAPGDSSGSAVAIERDMIAMGSPGDGPGSGAVYVFSRLGASWTEQAVLRATTAKPNDRLGASVAISDERMVAGAPGPQFGSRTPGYAHVYARTAVGWTEQARLNPPSPQTRGRFGTAVSITEHGRVLAGDPLSRKAFIFASVDGSWQQRDVLDGVLAGSFGSSICATGDTAVIGAPSAATPVGPSGAALVFSLA